ncbi:MAG: transposase [Chloroflexota bacterium]
MLRASVARFWDGLKQKTLSFLGEEVGPLTPTLEKLIRIWEILRIEEKIQYVPAWVGRPLKDRRAVARAFVAKSFLNLPSTVALVDRLKVDSALRRLCGFERLGNIPSESTFSRAFAEFAKTELGQRAHEELVKEMYGSEIVGHVSRDATAIEAREKPLKREPKTVKELAPRKKRGRPRKGEEKLAQLPPEPSRLEKQSQPGASLKDMLSELPKACAIGCKKNSQGFVESWQGYKLHLDVSDIGMPLSAILTSASLHDSQAAIPLLRMTADRTGAVLYEVMDSAYDSPLIESAIRGLQRVPIIDINPRRDVEKQEQKRQRALLKTLGLPLAEDVRFNERTTVERVNARLKDEFGARNLRVRGHAKAMCHLMFGVCVLAADAVLRLTV